MDIPPEEILVTSVQMNTNKIYGEDEGYYVLAKLQRRGTTCKGMARCELVQLLWKTRDAHQRN